VSDQLWLYNDHWVDNFPGAARVGSLGHLLTEPIELGWRAADQYDPTDPDRLAWRLERQITDRLLEALDARSN
jgi:hypothetical protein